MGKTIKSQGIEARNGKQGGSLARNYDLILGVPVDSTSTISVLSQVQENIGKKTRFFIVTPNPEIIVKAQSDPVLSKALSLADLSLPDGIGLVWASKFLTMRGQGAIQERVSGIDIVELLVKSAAQKRWRVFLLGGKPGVAASAATKLKTKNEKLKIEFSEGPWLDNNGKPVGKMEEEKEKESIKKINAFRPDILFVAFGAPKQEKWVVTNYNKIQSLVTMVVGGSFDYISGNVPRAPRWMREIGLEWLFRLVIEPRRIIRQLSLAKFVWLVLRQKRGTLW